MKLLQILIPLFFVSSMSYAQSETIKEDSVTRVRLDCSIKEFPSPLWLVMYEGKMFSIDSVVMKEKKILNPSSIKSVNVLKNQQELEKYGNAGKNGVVILTLSEEKGAKTFKSLKKYLTAI